MPNVKEIKGKAGSNSINDLKFDNFTLNKWEMVRQLATLVLAFFQYDIFWLADFVKVSPSIPKSNVNVQNFYLLASIAILIAKICTGNLWMQKKLEREKSRRIETREKRRAHGGGPTDTFLGKEVPSTNSQFTLVSLFPPPAKSFMGTYVAWVVSYGI